jgi:Retroviral aspartyl protease
VAPVRAILDTGAGPNLIREEILPEDWERIHLLGTPVYQIIGAGGRPLRQRGVITMHVQLGTLRVQSLFVVVTSLAPECILGCSTMGDRAFIAFGDRSTWSPPDCFLGITLSVFTAIFHV